MNESRHANFGAIQAIFLQLSWSQHKLAHSCQGRGQRSNGAINRNKHFSEAFVGHFKFGYSLSNSGRVIPKRRYEMTDRRERERERERADTKAKTRKVEGPPRSPVHQIWCNSDHYFQSYGILKKWHTPFFLDRPPS